jgi:hypothetical protein
MKIENGCKAIIVNSEAGHNGTSVTVGNYLGHIAGWSGDNRWEIDRSLTGTLGGSAAHVREDQLLRIDGFEEQDKVSDGKELINVD